jgi:hypothetical protein
MLHVRSLAILARVPGREILLTLLRIACRVALVAFGVALAMLWLDPRWRPEARTLELRVRRGPEVLAAARKLADRAVAAARERDLPAVASGKARSESEGDELTEQDRRLLERLLEEKLRE